LISNGNASLFYVTVTISSKGSAHLWKNGSLTSKGIEAAF